MHLIAWVLQGQEPLPGPLQKIVDFLDTPAPYSPFTEYLLVLFLLWLLARRGRGDSFDTKAQEVLEQKFKEGEIDAKTYEKYRQEMSIKKPQ